jgi:hypothetical protein
MPQVNLSLSSPGSPVNPFLCHSVNPCHFVKTPDAPPLVYRRISHVEKSFSLELYPSSVKILRPNNSLFKGGGYRKAIASFSFASKRRLRFRALNAFPPLISHFGMTYHFRIPDGLQAKKDLNYFLNDLRKWYRKAGYIWILEFQRRGTLHFHIWLTLPVSDDLHGFLASTWNRIVEPGNKEHLTIHLRNKNFISWEMRSAGYLCKYIDKEHQKRVPEGFQGVGRFWGCSRDLVEPPDIVSESELAKDYGGVDVKAPGRILRALCKSQEKKVFFKKWKNWSRRSKGDYTLLDGRGAFNQIIQYWEKEPPF